MDSAAMARWFADVAARATAGAALYGKGLHGEGLQCDRCGRVVAGISRYPEGWLCDACVAVVDGPEPDEDYADDVFVGWDASAELLDDMRREDL